MLRYVALMIAYPALVGFGFQVWIRDVSLTLGIVGLTLVLSSTVVCFDIIRRKEKEHGRKYKHLR